MADPTSLQDTRKKLRALASELVELADSFEPNPPTAMGFQTEFVKKAQALVAQAQNPMDYGVSLIMASNEIITIQALLSMNAIQSIPVSGSIDLQDLASATNAQPALLERLLRVLVGTNFIHQSATGDYSHSTLSQGFAKDGFAGYLLSFMYDFGIEIMTGLPEYLEEQRQMTITPEHPQGRFVEPGSGLNGTTHNPSTWRYGEEGKTIFEIMEKHPARLLRFQTMLGAAASVNPFVGFYDFGKLATTDPERAVLVDIGGGQGHAIMHMLSAYPNIKPEQCVLQDMQSVVDLAQSSNKDLPKGVQFQAHDYFSPQPVKHARAYYLRAIAHDLSDDSFVKVLKQITPVMAPDSKVLIADNLIPERGTQGMSGFMDMMMMIIGGKERTESDFREVCDRAGLKVDGFHRAGGEKTYAMVEASLK